MFVIGIQPSYVCPGQGSVLNMVLKTTSSIFFIFNFVLEQGGGKSASQLNPESNIYSVIFYFFPRVITLPQKI